MTVSVWFSKEWKDVIPFDRIIGVKDDSIEQKQFLSVILEEGIEIVVHPEEVDSFLEAYKTYVQISELVSLGVDSIDDSGPKKKGDPK